MKWKKVEQMFDEAMNTLGIDKGCILLLTRVEFSRLTGSSLSSSYGRMNYHHNVITVQYRNLNKVEIRETIYHELAHFLFPKKPHWWIECFSHKVSKYRGAPGRWTQKYNHLSAWTDRRAYYRYTTSAG